MRQSTQDNLNFPVFHVTSGLECVSTFLPHMEKTVAHSPRWRLRDSPEMQNTARLAEEKRGREMDTSCCLRHSGMTTIRYLRKALLRRFTFCVFASARLCPPLPIMSTPPLSSLLSVWSPSKVFLAFHVCASQPSCSTSLCFSAPSDPDTSHSDSQGCSINSVHACVCISSQGSVPFSKTFLQVSLASHHFCLC